ncbi:MAG: Response regulator of zinc sigma-54-dependent two-component system [Labilithrix sp.]|nr:Response regulator of zinc sigma-54-dependent two-component system [Labilithrix sp.]
MTDERLRDSTEVAPAIVSQNAGGIPRITAVSGPGAGRALAMSHATATAGRHATNDLVIEDGRVSGVHLELRRVGDRINVRDASSTNGTWFGGARVREVDVGAGMQLQVGDTTLRVDVDDAALPAAVSDESSFGTLVGTSTAMREIFAAIERVAKKSLNVVIQGEAGTGKEELARALVARSSRAEKPLVVIDVTGLPPSLLETVLFGDEQDGVATPGLLEASSGGTVLVDEVGALPLPTQAKLLRLLERQEVMRGGRHVRIPLDVRVLSATTRDLRHEIEHGRFREDLYFRLSQVRISVPPLRDRSEDIPLLAAKLLQAAGANAMIEAEALTELVSRPWPGNVRELRSTLERAAALTQDDVIRRVDVAGEGFGFRGTPDERGALDLSGAFKVAKERAIERFEAAYLAALMRRCNGNVSLASREAEIARHHLRELLRKRELYGIAWDKEKDEG